MTVLRWRPQEALPHEPTIQVNVPRWLLVTPSTNAIQFNYVVGEPLTDDLLGGDAMGRKNEPRATFAGELPADKGSADARGALCVCWSQEPLPLPQPSMTSWKRLSRTSQKRKATTTSGLARKPSYGCQRTGPGKAVAPEDLPWEQDVGNSQSGAIAGQNLRGAN